MVLAFDEAPLRQGLCWIIGIVLPLFARPLLEKRAVINRDSESSHYAATDCGSRFGLNSKGNST